MGLINKCLELLNNIKVGKNKKEESILKGNIKIYLTNQTLSAYR